MTNKKTNGDQDLWEAVQTTDDTHSYKSLNVLPCDLNYW
jgi:hypothetical protein